MELVSTRPQLVLEHQLEGHQVEEDWVPFGLCTALVV